MDRMEGIDGDKSERGREEEKLKEKKKKKIRKGRKEKERKNLERRRGRNEKEKCKWAEKVKNLNETWMLILYFGTKFNFNGKKYF